MSRWNRNCLLLILGCVLLLAAIEQAPPDSDEPVNAGMRQEIVSRWQGADHWALPSFQGCQRCHGDNGEAIRVRW